MTTESNLLSSGDVRAQLEQLYGAQRGHHVFAFLGSGTEEELRLSDGRAFHVVPVQSELDLRDRLCRTSPEENVVYLVPFEHDVPSDVRARFANGGRVYRIGKELRLRRMFGAKEVESEARSDALAAYLLRAFPDRTFSITQGVLTRDTMWETFLGAVIDLPCAGGLTLDVLLGFVARDARGPSLVKELESKGEGAVAGLVREYAAHKLGIAGGCLVDSWLAGRGATGLELAVLSEALVHSLESTSGMWLRMQIKAELGVGDVAEANTVARRLAAAVSSALLLRFGGETNRVERRKLLESAEARVDEPTIRSAIATSPRLPCAFRARLDAFGVALSKGVETRTVRSFADARDAFERLKRHEMASDGSENQTLARAESALRLLAFLVTTNVSKLDTSLHAYGYAETLGRWYVEEGGFVDWERYRARGPDSDAFGSGAKAVVGAVDSIRDTLDRKFAVALGKWIEAERPAQLLIPIDKALERIGAPLLESNPNRKLLVLLIDGMAWAQAVEILRELGRGYECEPWAPLSFRGWSKGGSASIPAVAAALPTITEVSRAAFFAGQLIADGPSESTSKDPERFRQHKALGKLCPNNTAPRLMLQGDAFGPDGHLAEPARTMILDARARVVGVVVNAIDDSLKASPQQERRWSLDVIKSLRDILSLARESGRTILLASDHGHVPSDRMKTTPTPSGGGARYRAWESETATVRTNELGFRGVGVRTSKGMHGVVLPTDDTTRYTSALHAGEHGGATLAEVLAPTLLLGCELDVQSDDASTTVIPFATPRWWHLQVEESVPAPLETVTKPKQHRKSIPGQLLLLEPTPAAVPAKPSSNRPAAMHPWAAPLLGSPLFDARAPKGKKERDDVLRCVDFLLSKPGSVVAVDVFASELGLPPFRVAGYVSGLSGVLNVDGYQVLAYEPAAKLVRLDREKLAAQFGVRFGDKP